MEKQCKCDGPDQWCEKCNYRRHRAKLERLDMANLAALINNEYDPSDPNHRHGEYGETSLHRVVTTWNNDMLVDMIERGADVNVRDNNGLTPLHHACCCMTTENPFMVLNLAYCGANVNAQDNWGYTPLHYAVGWLNANLVVTLLDVGANHLSKADDGQRPLELLTNPKPLPHPKWGSWECENTCCERPHILIRAMLESIGG